MPYIRSFYSFSSGIVIRNPQMHDVDVMVRIEEDSFGDPWSEEVLRETIESFYETSFCAVAGGRVVAFVICGLEDTGDEIYGHICTIATDPKYRNLGIGRDLIKHAERGVIARGATGMQLEVRESNVLAQHFYVTFSPFPSYYANGKNAILMMRWF